ncbi:MAG: hypothetical protein OXI50_01745 [Gammaproteobacteria bacterium]|nr:hypothetical protein [Gammaproteobacteria bacterium]
MNRVASPLRAAKRNRRNIVGSATLGWICCAQHIHPSGNAEPSSSDRELTERLNSVLNEIDVRLLDHVVVAGLRKVSMAERGML